MPPPIRVFLVDDSTVVRGALRRILDATADIRVVGSASNGRLGLEAIGQAQPDVVLLDIEMPELDGLATLPLLLAAHPNVRVIMASSLTRRGAQVTIEALAIGAADYVTKPTARAGPESLAPMAEQILAKIRALAPARPRGGDSPEPPSAPSPAPWAARAPRFTPPIGAPDIVAIASSTGGPNALVAVLRGLATSMRAPIIVTQHMPPVFTMLLAERLQRESGRRCVEATDGSPLLDDHVYIAPGDHHLLVGARDGAPCLRLSQSEPENHCRPSADPMFRSVSAQYGARALAVVLTGMGDDGRRGCEFIRRAGGRVMVQDEATSVVWGMPGAVARAGLADWVVPLPEIAPRHAQLGAVLR
ncbi:MAG: chemotaxis-specific protein-glutamate methyltransferase CheB [Gemmatimonadaceae bacterium]